MANPVGPHATLIRSETWFIYASIVIEAAWRRQGEAGGVMARQAHVVSDLTQVESIEELRAEVRAAEAAEKSAKIAAAEAARAERAQRPKTPRKPRTKKAPAGNEPPQTPSWQAGGWAIDNGHTTRPIMRAEALTLIDRFGWLALPGDDKKPYVPWNFDDLPAMPERSVLVDIWTRHTGHQILVLTGRRSGIVVADVDPRHGGTLATLWDLGWRQDTVQERTASGGWHVYGVCPPDGLRIDHQYAPGIELLGDGAVVAVAPSTKAAGPHARYEWLPGHSPFELAVAPLPDVVLADLHTRRAARAEVDDTACAVNDDEMRDVGLTLAQVRRYATAMYYKGLRKVRNDGAGRNNTMYWLARQLQSVGMCKRDVLAWVEQFGEEVRYG